MSRFLSKAAAAAAALLLSLGSLGAFAQKSGGVLKMPDFASPASMSIHEEITRAAINALMPVFNNLVLFDQHKAQNTIDTIVPDLAESWSWDAGKTALTFKLRHGIKWHDGKPFTAADVKCTWDLLQGKATEKLRLNPRKAWYRNVNEVTTLPGYSPDIAANRAEARAIMEKLGYGPDKRLAITVSTRNTTGYRDPAVIAIDQMKEVYIDAVLEPIETANWFPKVIRKDYTVGVNISETAVDDPDQMFYENYACGSDRNYTGFCDKQVDALIDQQSSEADPEKRRALVWEIERTLARDASRPIIFYTRAATCWRPRVKGLTIVANSVFNGWRFEDVWLDR